jgi:hypothetical protein
MQFTHVVVREMRNHETHRIHEVILRFLCILPWGISLPVAATVQRIDRRYTEVSSPTVTMQ